MKFATKSYYLAQVVLVSLLLAACSRNPASYNGGVNGGSSGGGGSSSTFTIGGTTSGLTGTGLVLQDNAGDNLAVAANGAFVFKTAVATGAAYSVSVLTQPSNPAQTCTVSSASGTASANVTTVQVACAVGSASVIGGQVTGLSGKGLVLQDNGGDNITLNANGSFSFATPLASGSNFSVTVLAQPTSPAQTCTVANGSGKVAGNVGNIVVTCSTGTLSVGGSVSGLSGTGLVLQVNGGNNVSITNNGVFQFPGLLPGGAAYTVTILSQPIGPTQTCTLTNGTGTATANVSNIQIVCPAVFHTVGGQLVGLSVPTGQTSKMVIQNNGGDNLPLTGNGAFTFVTPIAHASVYDVTVFVNAGTQPQGCITWGFNGTALSNITDVTVDCGHNDWTWMSGPKTSNQFGTTTTPPTPPPAVNRDTPGGSRYSASWTDLNGNLWLFSGYGYGHDSTLPNQPGFFNEMWEYTGTQSYFGGYGNFWALTPPASPLLVPAPRWGAVTWTDKVTGNLWLFGGQDAFNDFLNDVWMYKISTKTWTNVTGGFNQAGIYGTKGTPAPGNLPGGRWGATARMDTSGTIWLFGGYGYGASAATTGLLNDLWKYSGGQWTWVSGSNAVNPPANYGTMGTAAATNVPGGRQASVSWIDASGNFWLFGGYDLSSTGQPNAFNDLWEFSAGQWTWVAGANVVNQVAVYGTQGVAAATNVPGSRWSPAAWTDTHGNLWLFGGQGFDATGNGSLADLWEFTGGQWTWVKGSNSVSQSGTFGIQANPVVWPHVTDGPGSRWGAAYWSAPNTIDPLNPYSQFWMFGGEGFDSTSGPGNGLLSDLWRYLPFP